jgi:hypothetical protein
MRNRIYYALKPFLPARLRLAARRTLAKRQRIEAGKSWPILDSAARRPDAWRGWPRNRQFAFVLTHDVESQKGLDRVRQLAEIEIKAGVRSSFNFVPEGGYRVPPELRLWLVENGFEVGVHDLNHDGHLYRSYADFRKKAARINQYLRDWKAVGFRSAFMLRRLDWIHDLDVMYDASTFDTDPFEPDPMGLHTIFPAWVEGKNGRPGYVELPYTLPQDSTLFNLLDERDATLWCRKLDWVAENGGMALVNVHPDYIAFDPDSKPSATEYPIAFYVHLLEHVKARHAGAVWHALPKEVARHVHPATGDGLPSSNGEPPKTSIMRADAKTVWIDLDNTPHVPFFLPIIRELKSRGHRVVLTARDAFQVIELADRCGLPYEKVGRHYGKHLTFKVFGLVYRSLQLLPFALRTRPDIAVSHGARSQVLLANALRIPSVVIGDYEHAKAPPGCHSQWKIVPESIFESTQSSNDPGVLLSYPGLKEDVYSPDFTPNDSLFQELGIPGGDLLVTVRPPANEAHYRNPESDVLFIEVMRHLLTHPEVRIVLLPRNRAQGDAICASFPQWFQGGRTLIPTRAVDGLNLIWHSDLVVSGGGTMNREAAALGVPVYSIFRGKTGAVDRKLEQQRRLTMVRSAEEVSAKIVIQRRDRTPVTQSTRPPALGCIVQHIEDILAGKSKR